MEIGTYPREGEIPSPYDSSPNGSSSSNNVASLPPKTVAGAQATPKPIPRGVDANPFPTTFIQADTSSFKQVVQLLTGSAETAAKQVAAAAAATAPKCGIPPAGRPTGPKKPDFKLYERRNSMKNLKMIFPMIPAFPGRSNLNYPSAAAFSPHKMPEMFSPSMLDLPLLSLSPVTPLIPDPFGGSPPAGSDEALKAEEKAIAEKGFYLHPSPKTTPRGAEPPRLLLLFPVSSPRVSSDLST